MGQAATNGGGYSAAQDQSVDIEKTRRKLMKKLREIEDLEGRQKKGETLSDEQISKMKSRSQVEAEIIDLDNGGNGQVRKAQEPAPVAAAVKNGQTQERSDA